MTDQKSDRELLQLVAIRWANMACCDFMHQQDVIDGAMTLDEAVRINCRWLINHAEYCVSQIEKMVSKYPAAAIGEAL